MQKNPPEVADLRNLGIKGQVFLAPMAGFSDLPYRLLCRRMGASYAVGEMVASQKHLRSSLKTRERFLLSGEPEPRAIQLLGSNADDLADTARFAVSCGAQIVDFNCGCPAKKVCSVACGSALLKDEPLVESLLKRLVDSVPVPITVKMRTGWDADHINAVSLARKAEAIGVKMIVLHGRTREQGFSGRAEYETIKRVKQSVGIPVIANGDIDSGDKALRVLEKTGADGVMVGRAAMGNPWIFREIQASLQGSHYFPPGKEEILETMRIHFETHFDFYGEERGLKTIRKHLSWYFKRLDLCTSFLPELYAQKSSVELFEKLFYFLKRA